MLIIHMNILKRVERHYIFSLRQTCEFMYRDSTWFSNTRWHTILWTLAINLCYYFIDIGNKNLCNSFFFIYQIGFFYCVRTKVVKNFNPEVLYCSNVRNVRWKCTCDLILSKLLNIFFPFKLPASFWYYISFQRIEFNWNAMGLETYHYCKSNY